MARETNLVDALEKLKKSGHLGLWRGRPGGGCRRGPWTWPGPLCLVLGSEGEGLRPLVARTCDVLLTIPMAGQVGSLNVAAAAAVLCYEVAASARLRSRKVLD